MSAELARRSVADRRNGLLGWSVGLACYGVLVVLLYPTIRDSDSLAEAVDDYPDVLKEFLGGEAAFDFTTGAGFLAAEMYSLVMPALLAVIAIGFGASLGADQQSRLMDLILANPVSRRRVVLERALAMTVSLGVLGIVIVTSIATSGAFVDLGVGVSNLVAATVASILLVLFHGFVAMAVGAVTGSRSAAIGTATAVFAVGYLLSALGALISWLEQGRVLSPYYHAVDPNPLAEGWPLDNLVGLAVLCCAALSASVVLFERRDLV